MRAGRADAMAIFRTWLEDRTLLRFDGEFSCVAFALNARLVEVSESQLSLVSDDRWSAVTVPLRDDFRFGYTDMRDFPKEDEEFEHLIVVILPYGDGDANSADRFVLTELKEPINPSA